MKYLEWLSILLVVIVIIYMILKIVGQAQDNIIQQKRKSNPTPKEIEIISRDLRVKAENLLAMSEIYELQIVHYTHEIENIEDELGNDTSMTESERRLIIGRSLRLQERKCIIEGKMLKIDKELSEIAIEEYRRQVM